MQSGTTGIGAGGQQVSWWAEVKPEQWRTLLATWAGWVLDAFDFTLLLLVLGEVAKTFGVDLVAMGAVITGTLFCRLIGGTIVGTWADRAGRRLPMMVSILTFSIFAFLSGLAPDYTWFLIFRLLFGLGMGGEWSAGTSLAMESWPQRSRGFASGVLQGGWPVGYLIATLVYFLIFPIWGWRPLFWIGVLPALLVLYIRSAVPESPVWEARHEKLKKAGRSEGISLIELFHPKILGTTIHAFLVMSAVMFSYYCVSSLWPTFLTNDLKLDVNQKTTFLVLLNVGSLAGYWCAGALSERIGRRGTIAVYTILAAVFLPMYSLSQDRTLVMIGGIIEGFAGVGFWGVLPAYLTERFPTSVRGVGPGSAFHVGAAIGSTAPTVQAIFIRDAGVSMGMAIAAGAAVSLILLAILAFLGPEPKGKDFMAEAMADT